MIDRYTDGTINSYWNDKRKYEVWYNIEKMIADSNAENAGLDTYEWKQILFNEYDIKNIKRIEQDTKHDVAAFLQYICDENPKNARFIHSSLTSSDLVDTYNSFAIKKSIEYINDISIDLYKTMSNIGEMYKDVRMIGRTHGQHATITTLGHKISVYCYQLERCIRNLTLINITDIGYKVAGPVGLGCNMNEQNAYMLDGILDINRLHQNHSTQVIPRYFYYHMMSEMLGMSMILSSIATDLRLLNQTEIGEFTVVKYDGQWGSSSMPHKTNPISLEQVCGMSRLAKGYLNAFIDNMVLWNERDISNSCVERVVFPDMFHTVASQIKTLHRTIKDGKFETQVIRNNLLNAEIGILSNQLVQIILSKKDTTYIQAVKDAIDMLNAYKGMKIKDLLSSSIDLPDEINELKKIKI